MAVLLGLPNEALLRIFHYLPKSVKHPKPQADILSLSLTCKRLAPLVREVLCTAPILALGNIHMFLDMLFKYPDLQPKIRSLTVEAEELSEMWTVLDGSIPARDAELLSRCVSHVQNLDLDREMKQGWIAILSHECEWPGDLLSLVLTLLPNLSSLYLGGTPLYHLTILEPVLEGVADPWPLNNHWNCIRIPTQISAKLTSLELPKDFYLPAGVSQFVSPELRTYFPELRHLILPSIAVKDTEPKDIIPPKVETLVLIDCRDHVHDWVGKVAPAEGTPLPELRSLSLYWGCAGWVFPPPYDNMRRLGITCKSIPHSSHVIYSTVAHMMFLLTSDVLDDDLVYEHVPEGPSWPLSELNHPWLYTRAELDAFSSGRHKEAMEKWTEVGLDAGDWEAGDWEVDESEGEE
ncbi:unnamed protein product [Alternaria burnsii]|nr:unnamed protein product [Alternaria burnsii]